MGQSAYAKTTFIFLADLEHEFRVLWDPVRLGLANGEYERHLPISRRQRIRHCFSVACRPADGVDCAANHWLCKRSHLGSTGTTTTLFSGRGSAGKPRAYCHAELRCGVDGRWAALDT